MAQDPFGNQVNMPRFEPPKIPPKAAQFGAIAFVVAMLLGTSFYQVEPESVGVVLRFGVHIENTPPGLHFKLPLGIDVVRSIPVQRQLTEEFGFESPQAGRQLEFNFNDLDEQANMLTGDLNAAVVEWVVQYRIEDPVAYLFKVRNTRETFRDMSEAVMREAVGDYWVHEVIKDKRSEIASVAIEKMQTLCDLYETGIQVDKVELQDVTPPDDVKPAFNLVNEMEQRKEQLVNEAKAEYNQVIPRAQGQANQTIQIAEGYRQERVNRAKGEAARFEALYAEYRKAPEVTRKRIYLETVRGILPKVGRKIVVDDDVRGVLPLLNFDTGSGSRSSQSPAREGGS